MEHLHYNCLPSTNTKARELLSRYDSVIVTADEQTEGRGRKNRIWQGDAGKNIFCSIGIKHQNFFVEPHSFQFAGAILAYDTVSRFIPKSRVRLKYPNDIMVRNDEGTWGKICGVLTEHVFMGNHLSASVIGIGINVEQIQFPDDLMTTATSFKMLGYEVTPHDIFGFLYENIRNFDFYDDKAIFDRWYDLIKIEGKIVVTKPGEDAYIITEIMDDGRLKAQKIADSSIRIIDDGDTIRYDYE